MATLPVENDGACADLSSQLPAILTVEECAAFLRIGRTTAYEAVRLGQIPSVHVGRLVRVPRDRLLAWVAAGGHDSRAAKVA